MINLGETFAACSSERSISAWPPPMERHFGSRVVTGRVGCKLIEMNVKGITSMFPEWDVYVENPVFYAMIQ